MSDKNLFYYTLIFSILTLVVLFLSYRKDKTRLINGVIFNILLISISTVIVIGAFEFDIAILMLLTFAIISIFLVITVFGLYILIIGCLVNARIVLKRERRSFANMLTLFIGLGLLLLYIISLYNIEEIHPIIQHIISYITVIISYFLLSFYNYIVSSLLYSIYRPKYDKDYVIVLGSGLIDGNKVSKLLGARIDKAIDFYNKQKLEGKNLKIIFSGGQGKDETTSEALAMKNYALEKGVVKDDTIIEDKSTNTIENFKFSKQIMDNLDIENYDVIFTTSSYHVFRAAIYAKNVGLKTIGLGAKTAFYYLPNAMIREYIAIVLMKKKSYMVKVLLLTLLYISYLVFIYVVSKYLR